MGLHYPDGVSNFDKLALREARHGRRGKPYLYDADIVLTSVRGITRFLKATRMQVFAIPTTFTTGHRDRFFDASVVALAVLLCCFPERSSDDGSLGLPAASGAQRQLLQSRGRPAARTCLLQLFVVRSHSNSIATFTGSIVDQQRDRP